MSNFKGLYDIRPGTKKDANFILATFLRGVYYGDSWFSLIPKDIFMAHYSKFTSAVVLGPKSKVVVACLPDDPNVILGYAIVSIDDTKLHWCFVKSAWRNQGIARSLIPNTITNITHLSKLGKTLMHKLPNTIFEPFSY